MKVFSKTDIGKSREMNQDYCFVSGDESSLKIYILADGMGGYTGGEIASKLATESSLKYIQNNYENNKNNIIDLIKEAMEYANMMVYEKSRESEDLKEMGTTLDVLFIIGDKIYIGHVGDSKVYKIFGNEIKKITVDDSYVETLVKDGTITREEALIHPKRNMLTKAVGTNTFVMPEVYEIEVQKEDIILMCSDGLTNMIKEDEILEIVNTKQEDVAEELINAANAAGGMDNITVIVIKDILEV